ncbi:hypothetical protein [Bradyrhizobium sp. 200]|uniref:hypothetical protein n=1 Tax=Bradyrhizobium sp. 200 TaxID=2782665 RepID=UPI001FFE86DF|nr:hypothetical protein [Bradyrhizobium sp. 200]
MDNLRTAVWVDGVREIGVKAFTDFGIENLIELIRFDKENRTAETLIAPRAACA